MKKMLIMCLLTMVATQITKAQTNTVTGSVRDVKGHLLHYVFVADDQYKNATYSDSLGNFAIAVHPDSKLLFTSPGHRDTSVNVDKTNGDLQIVLGSSDGSNNTNSTKSTLSVNSDVERPHNVYLFKLPLHEKGNLHGSRYLFDNFVHGFFINASDVLIYNPNYLFDYDKIGGGFLVTQGSETTFEISWDQTKSFTLVSKTDESFTFEKVPAIDQSHYVQVLASGKKYKIYKLIKTKFVKSDFVNTGVATHGNDYDEYVDDADYYVFDIQNNQLKKLSLKKKSVKEDFAKEADKVSKYLSSNAGDISDAYLSNFGAYMNQ
jgi:hypothetical protein